MKTDTDVSNKSTYLPQAAVKLMAVSLYVSEYLNGVAARVCRSVFTLTPQSFSVPALFASKPLGSEGAIFHAH